MPGSGYATISRKKILEFLKKNSDRTVAVADIDHYLKAQDCEVNITTIYRYLDKLAKDGTVIKYVAEKGNQAVYQYVELGHHCEEHLHLQCVKCGKIIHLECEFMDEISEHILKDHGFELQCKNSILYGMCSACQEKICSDKRCHKIHIMRRLADLLRDDPFLQHHQHEEKYRVPSIRTFSDPVCLHTKEIAHGHKRESEKESVSCRSKYRKIPLDLIRSR